MARQSLMWTTLPNGLTADGRPRVSVLVSPRLNAEASPEQLSSFFPDWENWPVTLDRATFHISYGGATINFRAADADTSLYGGRDSAVWGALFGGDLFVRGFEFQDMSDHLVLSYDSTSLVDLLRGLYGRLGDAANGQMPLVSDLVDDPQWSELVSVVARLDREFADQDSGLRDPRLEFEDFRRTRFDKGEPARTLGALQLFHTPLARPVVRRRSRREDPRVEARWIEHATDPLPSADELVKQLDFHQVVAAMNSYPTLLRRLGLVVDFVLDRARLSDAADASLQTTVDFEAGLVIPRTPDASPVTHARLLGDRFEAVSNPFLGPGAFRVESGLLDLDPAGVDLIQVDVDGGGLKLMGLLRSLQRLNPDDERVDAVTRIEKEIGAPALRTAGMMLVQRNRGEMLQARFGSNKAKDDAVEKVFNRVPGATAPDLWAEDLVRGFRIDVWDGRNEMWQSLCRREARYELNDGALVVVPQAQPEQPHPEEEGIVRLGATQTPDPSSNPDIVKLHEALVAWTGWSLVAPPTGRALKTNDEVDTSISQTEAEVPPGLHMRSRFRPVRGSLPRLRFGRQYWMRARAVDLAGNSLPYQRDDFGPEKPRDHARVFKRFEPVAAPAVALVKLAEGKTLLPGPGESMMRLAIRSFNDTPADNTVPTTEVARRYIIPQRASARDAELHGKLDAGGKVDGTSFDLLANQKDLDSSDAGSALIEETVDTGGPLASGGSPIKFAVYRENAQLTYLPEPLAEAVAARFFDYSFLPDSKILPIPLYPDGAWPDAQPFQIELIEAAGEPTFEPATRTLRIPLAKGDRARLRLSMQLSKPVLEDIMALWPWLSEKARSVLEEMTLSGQHWMFTPWHTLELAHAVQRPLITPEFVELAAPRWLSNTAAYPTFVATCSIKSTDRVDLLADWHEPSDSPSVPESHIIGVDRARREVAFSIKITDPKSYATQLGGHERGGVPEHLIVGPDRIRVGEAGHQVGLPKPHEFHDTRYRRIEYWLEATSSFREYMPTELLTQIQLGKAEPTDDHIKVVGPSRVTWIASSAPPPAPHVLYVVPTFGWVRTADAQGNASHWRRGGGLRVYLDRPWNVSGYGEMLAVVLPSPAFDGDPESEPAGAPYKHYVTQWGNDPIWQSPYVAGLSPTRANFPLARTAPDPSGVWLPKGAPATESDQEPGPFMVTGLRPAGVPQIAEAHVEIAPHDVFYDEQRQLWYCDIEIDQGGSYWPLIRLALARYQPTSVPGAHLSQAVLADFMALTADRWLTVTRSDARRRQVAVFGVGFSDSSGHKEAANSRAMSIFDPLDGRIIDLQPVRISPTTVFEVWVEQLDPAFGEDFGWQRVLNARVEVDFPAPAAAERAVGSRFVPADITIRALEFNRSRRFTELAAEGLVAGLLDFLLLWVGAVILPPEAPLDARYRLVIAEYEEYPVDGDPAYFKVPTRKDRRLVFVEHVDLR